MAAAMTETKGIEEVPTVTCNYPKAFGNFRPLLAKSDRGHAMTQCQYCGMAMLEKKETKYRHRTTCKGLQKHEQAESDIIATRYSSNRSIRQKLTRHVQELISKQQAYIQPMNIMAWPVAFIKYIRDQVKHLKHGTGHNVSHYFKYWQDRNYNAMPVLRNPEMYLRNKNPNLKG
jgi:hypothetical protein